MTKKLLIQDKSANQTISSNILDKDQIFSNQSIYQLFSETVAISPHKIMIANAEKNITYYNALVLVESFSNYLWNQGICQHKIVVVQVESLLPFILTLFACFRIGAIPLLSLPAHREKELVHLINTSAAEYLITEQKLLNQQPSIYQKVTKKTNIKLLLAEPKSNPNNPSIPSFSNIQNSIRPENIALMLISGGTTGLPKIIARTHQDYIYNFQCAIKATHTTQDDVYMTVLPVAHNFTLGCPGILGIIACGATLVECQNASPDTAFNTIESYKVTLTSIVPSIADLWVDALQYEDRDFSSLRLIQVGGAKFSIKSAQHFDAVFSKKLQQVYGMAEGLICMTDLFSSRKLVCFTQGKPISPFDQLLIIDENGKPAANQEGELLTKGPYTISAYYNNPKANQDSFSSDGYYHTGDKVKLLKSGDIIVTGRIKDTIIRTGENINCSEIEEYALYHAEIKEAVLIGIPDTVLGEKTCLFIRTQKNRQISYTEIRNFFKKLHIAEYKIPDEVRFIQEFPKTAVGKIDRKKLLNLQ